MCLKGDNTRDFALKSINNAINNAFGILSLTQTPDNILMWSHYAENHTGFVLEFDETHSFFDQRKTGIELSGHVKEVRYTNERPKFSLFNPDESQADNRDKWVKDFVWVKSYEWSYENELRMLYPLRDSKWVIPNGSDKIYLFPLPMNSIKSIIFGCKMSEDKKTEIKKIISDNSSCSHMQLKQAVIDDKEYKLNILE